MFAPRKKGILTNKKAETVTSPGFPVNVYLSQVQVVARLKLMIRTCRLSLMPARNPAEMVRYRRYPASKKL